MEHQAEENMGASTTATTAAPSQTVRSKATELTMELFTPEEIQKDRVALQVPRSEIAFSCIRILPKTTENP